MKTNAFGTVASEMFGDLGVRTLFCIPSFPSLPSVQKSSRFPVDVLVLVGLEDSTAPYMTDKSNFPNLVNFQTCDKPYKNRNLTNFANSTNFVPSLAEFVLVGLEDSTAPYKIDKSKPASKKGDRHLQGSEPVPFF